MTRQRQIARRPTAADWFAPNAKNAASFAVWGAALAEQKHYEEALVAFECAVAAAPNSAAYHAAMGAVLQRLGKSERAAQAYEAALKHGPADVQILANLGEVRLERFDDTGALDAFERALAVDPKNGHPAKTRIRALVAKALADKKSGDHGR